MILMKLKDIKADEEQNNWATEAKASAATSKASTTTSRSKKTIILESDELHTVYRIK